MRRLIFALPASLLAACGAVEPPDEVVTGIAVMSNRGFTGSYGDEYQTFAITNKIGIVETPDGESHTIDPAVEAQILDQIRTNLTNYGYQEDTLFDPANPTVSPPDLGVQVNALFLDVDVYAPAYWCGYGGYYGGWYWGYGGYYCGYPYWTPVGSYKTGTLLMELVDVKNAPPLPPPGPGQNPTPTLNTVWLGLEYGVLANVTVNMQRVLGGIDQAFEQSPYLKH